MDRRGAACGAWRLLLELVSVERSRLPSLAAELGLSEPQCEVLRRLDPEEPLAMCRLAERLDCDPSNVTGIVDRLEARGLVERRPDERDRRVRKIVLTPAGRKLRAELDDRLSEPPSALRALSPGDQERLLALLRRAVDASR